MRTSWKHVVFYCWTWAGLCIRVQEDGSVVGEDPGEWVGCQHGVIDDSTCAYMTELWMGWTVNTDLYSISETAGPGPGPGSKGLNMNRRSGRGWVTHIWRRINREETLKNMRTDTFISRRWVSLSDSGQCEVAWYMVTQSGLCPGLQPIWEERRLNLYPHSSGIWAWRQSWLALCEFPAYPAFLSNFITRGVQKNLSTFFLFLQLKSKLVLRSRGVWNIDKTYGKPDVCQNMLSNVWLAKAEYQELLTQRSLHNQHYRIKTGKETPYRRYLTFMAAMHIILFYTTFIPVELFIIGV